MNVRLMFVTAMLVMGLFVGSQRQAMAQEKVVFNPSVAMKDNLASNVGKRVSLVTSGKESVEGTIEKVGDHFVLISRLSGKDFYDALVRIDDIKSVIFKAR